MKKVVHTNKKTFVKYDDTHYLVYLNEEIIPEYVPESHGEEPLPPVTGYAYTGNFSDGGTLIEATEPTYDAFVSGLVRLKYPADRVEAITLNKLSDNKERSAEFNAEFKELELYREQCKANARIVLDIL